MRERSWKIFTTFCQRQAMQLSSLYSSSSSSSSITTTTAAPHMESSHPVMTTTAKKPYVYIAEPLTPHAWQAARYSITSL